MVNKIATYNSVYEKLRNLIVMLQKQGLQEDNTDNINYEGIAEVFSLYDGGSSYPATKAVKINTSVTPWADAPIIGYPADAWDYIMELGRGSGNGGLLCGDNTSEDVPQIFKSGWTRDAKVQVTKKCAKEDDIVLAIVSAISFNNLKIQVNNFDSATKAPLNMSYNINIEIRLDGNVVASWTGNTGDITGTISPTLVDTARGALIFKDYQYGHSLSMKASWTEMADYTYSSATINFLNGTILDNTKGHSIRRNEWNSGSTTVDISQVGRFNTVQPQIIFNNYFTPLTTPETPPSIWYFSLSNMTNSTIDEISFNSSFTADTTHNAYIGASPFSKGMTPCTIAGVTGKTVGVYYNGETGTTTGLYVSIPIKNSGGAIVWAMAKITGNTSNSSTSPLAYNTGATHIALSDGCLFIDEDDIERTAKMRIYNPYGTYGLWEAASEMGETDSYPWNKVQLQWEAQTKLHYVASYGSTTGQEITTSQTSFTKYSGNFTNMSPMNETDYMVYVNPL